jgi:hypothetical protein
MNPRGRNLDHIPDSGHSVPETRRLGLFSVHFAAWVVGHANALRPQGTARSVRPPRRWGRRHRRR